MKAFLFSVVVWLILAGTGWYSVKSVGDVPVARGQYSIPSGATFSDLQTLLRIDVSDWRYRTYRKFFAPSFELKSGTFEIPEDTNFSEALERYLKKPVHTDLTFMILPGWNRYDIDAYLAEKKFIKAGDLIHATPGDYSRLVEKYPFLKWADSFEGFLYPDTYRIRQSADLREFLDTLLSVFSSRIYTKLDASQKKTLYSTLTLASIVEREERNPDEKAVVAGILLKRLKIGMTLWADATLCYALELRTKECTPAHIVDSLESESPYNTRKVRGLPPTPISNPSRETWLAALYPKASEYLYYLHDDSWSIHYAATNDEHNANKRKYLGR